MSGFFVLCLDVDLANPYRYRQRAMVLLNKVLHHTWSSTNHASWIEKNQQCPTTTKGSFRHVFKTPGALLPPAATQELYRHYDWNDDDSAAFMTAAYYVVAEFDLEKRMGALKSNGTTSRNALVPSLNLDKDTPSDSVQATAQLCFELMCLHEKDFQTHLLLDATPTGRGWYADMQDVVWSRHPALAKTLRPIVELGCSCNERGEPAPNPLDVYALARAPHHERAIPTWALTDLHA